MELRMFKAENGYVWAEKNDNNNVLGNIVYLGINDSIDNYVQIPEIVGKPADLVLDETISNE